MSAAQNRARLTLSDPSGVSVTVRANGGVTVDKLNEVGARALGSLRRAAKTGAA